MQTDIIHLIVNKAKIQPDETMSGHLFKKAEKILKEKVEVGPSRYFFLTSLCNPMDSYIKMIFPDLIQTKEVNKKKMIRGNKLHAFAHSVFTKMKGFESSEASLDGHYCGLPVIGRIDAKINGSIIEVKTSDVIPLEIDDVMNKRQQDIEQLAFYAVLDPTKPKINYLVYISQDFPRSIKVYKLIIQDFNQTKRILDERINQLKEAIEQKDPAKLGSCRYCTDDNCLLKKNRVCKWFSLPKKEFEIIKHIGISKDDAFEKELTEKFDSYWDERSKSFFIPNILLPKKLMYSINSEDEDSFDESAEKALNKDFIKNISFEFAKDAGKEMITPESLFPEISFRKENWFKNKSSKTPEGELLPFIACTNNSKNDRALAMPNEFHIAELGIVASIFNVSKGYLFVYYPYIGRGKFRVFKINFSFDNSINQAIKEILDILKSEDISQTKNLPDCPKYFCDKCKFKPDCKK
jgi:CRISPR/Cas system-associated exonuclease Cas4 (RecB family)